MKNRSLWGVIRLSRNAPIEATRTVPVYDISFSRFIIIPILEKAVDFAFLYADTTLEFITINRHISQLQGWLFIQNQKCHGLDDVSLPAMSREIRHH